ncbi:MAG: formyltransferase family protein [Pseudomonadota bacterium]
MSERAPGKRLTLGILLSAGGSACAEVVKASRHLPVDFVAVTDRPCGAEDKLAALGLPTTRIESREARDLSKRVAAHFVSHGARVVIFHFSRLVTRELFDALPCYNIHPSLLPAFPGMTSVRDAREVGVRFLGATAHSVDAGVDTGRIIVQAVTPVPPGADEAWWNRAAFLQKALVTLAMIERLLAEHGFELEQAAPPVALSPYLNPPLADPRTAAAFRALQVEHGIVVLDPAP